MYITRDGRQSVITLENGNSFYCYFPIKKILECFDGEFEMINKGIAVSPRFVVSVNKSVYTMNDGKKFTGRIRTDRKQIESIRKESEQNLENCFSGFSILDKMPLAFCVIEMIFNSKGKGVDFIFRYCNKEMENFEGKSLDDMLGRSFYEVFVNGDKKWLAVYADVALNGTSRIIEDYSPEVDSNIRIYCYQPKVNFVACTLVKI